MAPPPGSGPGSTELSGERGRAEPSAYRKVFSSDRGSRRPCSSRQLAWQRCTWAKLRAKHSPGHFRPTTSGRRGGPEGESPLKSSQRGKGPPCHPRAAPPPGPSAIPSCTWKQERRGPAPPGSAHPIPARPAPHTWPGVDTGWTRGLGPRQFRGADLSCRSQVHVSISCPARRLWWVSRSQRANLEGGREAAVSERQDPH